MSYCSGRAIAQLAGLLGPAALAAPWSAAFGGPAPAPQPRRCAPLRRLRRLLNAKRPNLLARLGLCSIFC